MSVRQLVFKGRRSRERKNPSRIRSAAYGYSGSLRQFTWVQELVLPLWREKEVHRFKTLSFWKRWAKELGLKIKHCLIWIIRTSCASKTIRYASTRDMLDCLVGCKFSLMCIHKLTNHIIPHSSFLGQVLLVLACIEVWHDEHLRTI